MNSGIYIHVPFCLAKCAYCDFYSVTDSQDHYHRYVENIVREIGQRADRAWQNRTFDTIYFGGGTPSVLKPSQIANIVDSIRGKYAIESDCEITLESNPETVDKGYFGAVKDVGVNRISIGIQSFIDSELKTLGRIHSAQTGIKAIAAARESGFDNLSIDLIFGIPGQSLQSWERTLAIAIEQNPAHISAYGLTIEPGTKLESQIVSGEVAIIDEEIQLEMYDKLIKTLAINGYVRYEISNFARDKKISRHNLKYWKDNYYIGFGPSAHSYDGEIRIANIRDLVQYNMILENNQLPIEFQELLSDEQKAMERLMMGIRLAEGVPLEDIRTVIDENSLESLRDDGLIAITDKRLLITEKGLPVSDKIIAELLKV